MKKRCFDHAAEPSGTQGHATEAALRQKLIEIMAGTPGTLQDLEQVKALGLNDWYIAAGYVRNRVWDHLHGIDGEPALADVDVIHFDATDLCEETDRMCEAALRAARPDRNWSVKNQARMHVRNHHEPYVDVADAMKRWPETATAVGITLTDEGNLDVIAPHGLADLFALVLRQSPCCGNQTLFLERIRTKKWKDRWHRLQIIDHVEG